MDAPPPDRSPATEGTPPHEDAAAWDALVRRLKPAWMLLVIGSSMSRKLREHCAPEDIWQETLANAWRDRSQHAWRDETAFRAWLFEIARNRIREAARRMAAEKRGSGSPARRFTDIRTAESSTVSHLLPADSATPSRIASRGERKAAVQRALADLPPQMAEVVRLHLVEDLTMERVAERMGIGLSSAWRRYRKASDRLARLLPPGTSEELSAGG